MPGRHPRGNDDGRDAPGDEDDEPAGDDRDVAGNDRDVAGDARDVAGDHAGDAAGDEDDAPGDGGTGTSGGPTGDAAGAADAPDPEVTAGSSTGHHADGTDLPASAIEEAERLTRLARRAAGAERAAYLDDRADLVAEYGYRARVREEDDTLVLHPADWVDDGTVRTDRVDDLDRAVELSLSGPGDPEDWAAVAEHNRAVAESVRAEHGRVHGENAEALAEFASNHYAKPVGRLTPAERREFVEEYFVRNAWPDDRQRSVVERSVELAVAADDGPAPP